jgi:DUF971 family protein
MKHGKSGMSEAWPEELRVVRGGSGLAIRFRGGESGEIASELLRVESPSAEVKGHGPGQERLEWGKRNVRIAALNLIGNYAVRITFDDGHDTGLYTWSYLQTLLSEGEGVFAAYEAKLREQGLTRG